LSESKKAAKSISIMMLVGIGSKLLGFFREMLIASKFGSGIETDIFFISLTATSLFIAIFTQSLNISMIPVMLDIEKKQGKLNKLKFTNNILNIVIFFSILISIIGWFLSPFIATLLAPGFVGANNILVVNMIRIGIPVIIFSGILGVYRGYLQSEGLFLESSLTNFPYNITFIIFLIFFSSLFGIIGLMFTSVIAVASQILIQLLNLRKTDYSYKWIVNFKDKDILKTFYLVLPIIISVVINDLNKIIDKSLASTLIEGSISALGYSNRLNHLFLSSSIVSIATVFFPMLTKKAKIQDNYFSFKKLIINGIQIVLIIAIPITIILNILSEPLVKIIFERGSFDANSTIMVSQGLVYYSLGFIGLSLRVFLVKVYYALSDTKTPMINGLLTVAINLVLSFCLIGPMGYIGLALGTSIATTFTSILLLLGIQKKIGSLSMISLFKIIIKISISSIIMGIAIQIIYYLLIQGFSTNIIMQLFILSFSIIIGLLVYLTILYFFKIKEVNWFIKIIRNKFNAHTY
jgi:putative peptidoglycan lipid II flippase